MAATFAEDGSLWGAAGRGGGRAPRGGPKCPVWYMVVCAAVGRRERSEAGE